jgi:hypothetical protein
LLGPAGQDLSCLHAVHAKRVLNIGGVDNIASILQDGSESWPTAREIDCQCDFGIFQLQKGALKVKLCA